jgi:hypothetical protein
MLAKINGSSLHGVEAFRITIEVSVANGQLRGEINKISRELTRRKPAPAQY